MLSLNILLDCPNRSKIQALLTHFLILLAIKSLIKIFENFIEERIGNRKMDLLQIKKEPRDAGRDGVGGETKGT